MWRAKVETDFGFQGVAVYLGRQLDGVGMQVLSYSSPSLSIAPENTTTDASLRLEEGAARALYDALAEYFGALPASQTQRQDYLHERARVDRLLEHVTQDPIVLFPGQARGGQAAPSRLQGETTHD